MEQAVAVNANGEFKLASENTTDTKSTCHAGKSCRCIRKSVSLSVSAVFVTTDNVSVDLDRSNRKKRHIIVNVLFAVHGK